MVLVLVPITTVQIFGTKSKNQHFLCKYCRRMIVICDPIYNNVIAMLIKFEHNNIYLYFEKAKHFGCFWSSLLTS